MHRGTKVRAGYARYCSTGSEPNPFYLILRKPLLRSVIELGRPRALVGRHFLGVLKRTAVQEVRGDPSRPERMIADRSKDARRGGAPADHAPGGGLIHGLIG